MRTLRLRCECGRNLADAERPARPDGTPEDPDWTVSGVVLTGRPNVPVRRWRHGPHRREWRYTIACRCGRAHRLSSATVAEAWHARHADPDRLVYAVVGVDV